MGGLETEVAIGGPVQPKQANQHHQVNRNAAHFEWKKHNQRAPELG
jgi:hypothetical protein